MLRKISTFASVYEKRSVMDAEKPSVEELIATVLTDIQQKGYSSIQPFDIGEVEERMMLFAQANGVMLGSDRLYMSAKQLQHCMRASKLAKGLVVSPNELILFPANRFQMELYYDGECFIYTDGQSKFIVHPNYKMKVSRDIVKLVNFITATRIKDPAEFTLPKYIKIETDRNSIERRSVYQSEGNQAARSNCSSSLRKNPQPCHRSAHRGSTWFHR